MRNDRDRNITRSVADADADLADSRQRFNAREMTTRDGDEDGLMLFDRENADAWMTAENPAEVQDQR